jgi:ABC-2 type transport system permease protein
MAVVTPALEVPVGAPPAPRPVNQPRVFRRLRWAQFRNSGLQAVASAPVRVVTILACSVVVWGTVYGVSVYGFEMLQQQKIPPTFVGILFDFLFLALAVMLLFSSSVMLYNSLFTTPETRFLLSTPARADHVFAYKFQTAMAFSSWAFVLLGSPIPVAHGVVAGAPWYFYALLPLFFVGFVLVPGSLGGLACLAVVNLLPRRKTHALVLAGIVVVFLGVYGLYRAGAAYRSTSDGRQALQALLGQFSFAQSVVAPSHWMSQGLMAASRREPMKVLLPLALVWSNGLFLYLIATGAAAALYRRGYDRMAGLGSGRRVYGGEWADRLADRLVWYLDRQTRLLVVKDFRTFRRDPAQWGQLLVFAGLVFLYVLNSQRFYQADIGRPFQNGISLMNLSATSMLMCAYMGRFIYPMLSLEGRKFWVLGLLPLPRERLLVGKFAFAATGGFLVGEFLIVASDLLLGMPAAIVGLHALTMFILALALSGLSVGLGAALPNFRETDGSKIAVGFGGTLNLIVSLLLLVLVIGLINGPSHAILALSLAEGRGGTGGSGGEFLRNWLVPLAALGVAAGVAATWFPMRLGARTLRRMEF